MGSHATSDHDARKLQKLQIFEPISRFLGSTVIIIITTILGANLIETPLLKLKSIVKCTSPNSQLPPVSPITQQSMEKDSEWSLSMPRILFHLVGRHGHEDSFWKFRFSTQDIFSLLLLLYLGGSLNYVDLMERFLLLYS